MSADLPTAVLPFSMPAPFQTPTGYFRSKLFSSNAASNPLVAAASPLLSLLERLCVSQTLPSIEHFRENIEHELFAFHSRLIHQQYTEDTIAIGHYLLSATIDELLGKNYVRLYGQVSEFKAFTPSNAQDTGPETQFFIIVKHLKECGHHFLDLVELAYYCLIAGFEGEHHRRADGRQILENLIEDLHKLIQSHRVHQPQLLFKEPVQHNHTPKNHRPLIGAIVLSLSLIVALYAGSQQLLNHQAKHLLQEVTAPTSTGF
ncbi:MAG: type IVB secretion system protein IcmH/DotU [Gammaproteobacteria bacterium]|nr:type IVB secretion system protein IcmH/DotU [Gammaproteobacteria bacterium]